jgi:tetratricopeptide (TPR) repeat protein
MSKILTIFLIQYCGMKNSYLFGSLFRKYRLRSECETLADFGDLLQEYGYFYEPSLFSHWQKGSRVPRDRELLLAIIRLFVQKKAIRTREEVSQFMEAAGQPGLTSDELHKLPYQLQVEAPFTVPRQLAYFEGRSTLIESVKHALMEYHTVLLHGPSAVGKTSIAIAVAHQLQNWFSDGILWYQLDTTSPDQVISSICHTFGNQVGFNVPLDRAAELYRSTIARKRVLLIFDSVSTDTPLDLLLPNSSHSAVLVTGPRYPGLVSTTSKQFQVPPFSLEESNALFSRILGKTSAEQHQAELQQLSETVGYNPLAIQMLAKQILNKHVTIEQALSTVSPAIISLQNLAYHNTTLGRSLDYVFQQLSPVQLNILSRIASFDGATVSISALASPEELVQQLYDLSLVEFPQQRRVQLHPFVKTYVRDRYLNTDYTLWIMSYYIRFIKRIHKQAGFYELMMPEIDSIVGVLKAGISGKQPLVCELWKLFSPYYFHVVYWKDFQACSKSVLHIAEQLQDLDTQIFCLTHDLGRLCYYDTNLDRALSYAKRAVKLSEAFRSPTSIAEAYMRYGKLLIMKEPSEKAKELLESACALFASQDLLLGVSHCYRYLSEYYVAISQFDQARQMLDKSLESLLQSPSLNQRIMYRSVLNSHYGVLALIQENWHSARKYFEEALKPAAAMPLTRGTYTWFSNIGLAQVYKRLGYQAEAQHLFEEGLRAMKALGIEKSYIYINMYTIHLGLT